MADDDTPFIKNQSPGEWTGEKSGFTFPNPEYRQWRGEREDSPLARNVWLSLKRLEKPGAYPNAIERTDMRIWNAISFGWYRQCSIGYHEECSDEDNNDSCKCPHHTMGYVMDVMAALQRAEPGTSRSLTIAHDDTQWMVSLQLARRDDAGGWDDGTVIKTDQSLLAAFKALVAEANINQV